MQGSVYSKVEDGSSKGQGYRQGCDTPGRDSNMESVEEGVSGVAGMGGV